MRIVGGEFRGRALATPRDQSIRPTTDRTREALFNVLTHRYADQLEGARVLDLFPERARLDSRRFRAAQRSAFSLRNQRKGAA